MPAKAHRYSACLRIREPGCAGAAEAAHLVRDLPRLLNRLDTRSQELRGGQSFGCVVYLGHAERIQCNARGLPPASPSRTKTAHEAGRCAGVAGDEKVSAKRPVSLRENPKKGNGAGMGACDSHRQSLPRPREAGHAHLRCDPQFNSARARTDLSS